MTKFILENNDTAAKVHLEMRELANFETTDIAINSQHFNAVDMQHLINFLQNPECNVSNLSLLSQNIADEEVIQLCGVLQATNKLHSFEIGAYLTIAGLQAIENLITETNIQALRVANANITRDHMAILLTAIDGSRVSKLSLADCVFEDGRLLDNLVTFLNRDDCKIDTFAMSGRNMTDLEITKIAGLNGSNIKDLHIGGQETALDDVNPNQSMAALATCLRNRNSKVEALHLHQGKIGANELAILGEVLNNSNIKKLEISNNDIGDLGAFTTLLSNRTCQLTDLKLDSCGLNEAAVNHLLGVLRAPNTSLERILLDKNVAERLRDQITVASETKQRHKRTQEQENYRVVIEPIQEVVVGQFAEIDETINRLNRRDRTLKEVKLRGDNFDVARLNRLLDALQNENWVENFNFNTNEKSPDLTNEEVDRIISFLNGPFSKVNILSLWSNKITAKHMADLGRATTIKSLFLNYVVFGDEGLANLFNGAINLRYLSNRSSNITEIGVKAIAEYARKEGSSLNHVDCDYVKIGRDALDSWATTIEAGCSVNKLRLNISGALNRECTENFYQALHSENSKVSTLTLTGSRNLRLGDIVNGDGRTLTRINVHSSASIDEIRHLCHALGQQTHSISDLDFFGEKINPDFFAYLRRNNLGNAIAELKNFNIGFNEVEDQTLKPLAEMFLESDSPIYLDVGNNKITDNGIASFVETLLSNKRDCRRLKLSRLDLDYNKLTSFAGIEILRALDYLVNLTVVDFGYRPNISPKILDLVSAKLAQDRSLEITDEQRAENEVFYDSLRSELLQEIFITSAKEAFSARESRFIIESAIRFGRIGHNVAITDEEVQRLIELTTNDPVIKEILRVNLVCSDERLEKLDIILCNIADDLETEKSDKKNQKIAKENFNQLVIDVESLKKTNLLLREQVANFVNDVCAGRNITESLELLKEESMQHHNNVETVENIAEELLFIMTQGLKGEFTNDDLTPFFNDEPDAKSESLEDFYNPELFVKEKEEPDVIEKEKSDLKILELELKVCEINNKLKKQNPINAVEYADFNSRLIEHSQELEFLNRNRVKIDLVEAFDTKVTQFQEEINEIENKMRNEIERVEGLLENAEKDEEGLEILSPRIAILEEIIRVKDQLIQIREAKIIRFKSLIEESHRVVKSARTYCRLLEEEPEIRTQKTYYSYQEVMSDIVQSAQDDKGNFNRHPIFALLESPVELHDYIKGNRYFDIKLILDDPNYKDHNTEMTECVEFFEKIQQNLKILSGVRKSNLSRRRDTEKFMISNSDLACISEDENTKGYLVVSGSDLTFSQDYELEKKDTRYKEMEFFKVKFVEDLEGDKEIFNYPYLLGTRFRFCNFKDIKDFNKIADEDSIKTISITNSEFVNVDFSNMDPNSFKKIMGLSPKDTYKLANTLTDCILPDGLEKIETQYPGKIIITQQLEVELEPDRKPDTKVNIQASQKEGDQLIQQNDNKTKTSLSNPVVQR